jgi:chromate transporter
VFLLVKKILYKDFLKDVLILAFTSFGGPQVHFAMYMDRLVKQKKYLTSAELMEIQALCSVLPGPTSTQTITAIGYKIGGPKLAYITLIVWITPAVTIMTAAAFGMTYLRNRNVIRFIQPVAIGFLIFSGYSIAKMVLKSKLDFLLMVLAAVLAFVFRSPYICPIVLLIGGFATSLNYKQFPKQTHHKMIIPWANFHLFWLMIPALALLGHFTNYQPIILFENFYRNGSLVFGGGQVLAPILYTEFVNFKNLIRHDDFLAGMALSQSLPGPVFSLTSYLGALAMKGHSFWEQLLGSIVGTLGIFLPGTFLIFFIYRIWGQLKQYRGIRASLQGINAATTGLTLAAAVTFLVPMFMPFDITAIVTVLITIALLQFTKIPSYFIFIGALVLGLII